MANHEKNHPAKGSQIKVEPIRSLKDIKNIKKILSDNVRDLSIFTVGVNTNLRASDILSLKIGQVRYLRVGDHFELKEQKTGKARRITLNQAVVESFTNLIASINDVDDEAWLYQSKRKGRRLTVSTLNNMVKAWCRTINLTGNYGSHTLRKTFGYMQRTQFNVDLPTLMVMFNHATQRQTLEYLCVQPEEIRDAYLNVI